MMPDLTYLIRRAEILRRLETNPIRSEWWMGYLHGLRRAHHGEQFGAEQHAIWSTMTGDAFRDARRLGYLAGLTGTWKEPT